MATSTIITIATLAVTSIISLAGGIASESVREKETKKQVDTTVKNLVNGKK